VHAEFFFVPAHEKQSSFRVRVRVRVRVRARVRV